MIQKILTLIPILLFAGFTFCQTRMISHVTPVGGGFTTQVQIENPTASQQEIRLVPYDLDGNQLTPFEASLPGQSTIWGASSEIFGSGAAVSHFIIEGDAAAKVTVAYDFGAGNGSPAHVRSSDVRASGWRVFPGEWSLVFDGLAIVNTGREKTDVWISQKDYANNIIRVEKVAEGLAPNAKALYVIGSPNGSSFSLDSESTFEISADQKLAITALRGTLGNEEAGLLWGNDALALSLAESSRDEAGIWFIKDGSLYDVMEMMGYNVAWDRLYQAELFKRVGRGRSAELFGQPSLMQDVLTLLECYSDEELDQLFRATSEDNQTIIQAYVDGFNRRIAQVNSDTDLLPMEYKRLGVFEVENWHYRDVLAWLAMLQRDFSLDKRGLGQFENAALANDLIDKFGFDEAEFRFEDLRWVNDSQAPTMIPATEAQKRAAAQQRKRESTWDRQRLLDLRHFFKTRLATFETNQRQRKEVGSFVKMGSYAWAVSGRNTQSGNPILYSGPQLGITSPSPVIEGSIESETLTVSGMSIPGIPAIIVGRTPHHAWSMQVGHAQSWDYYLEEEANAFLHHTVRVKVAPNQEFDLPVHRTQRGPVISQDPWVSWKYAHWGHEFDLAGGIVGMARARTIEEFAEAVSRLGVSQHICYVDKEGNIAYWMSGREPVRPEGNWRFPQGFIHTPFEYDAEVIHPTPHARNPERGWFGGWNTKAMMAADDRSSTYSFGPFQRGHVIQELLDRPEKFTREEIKDMAISVASTMSADLGGVEWPTMRDKGRFMEAVVADPTPERLEAIEILENWDGRFPGGGPENWVSGLDIADAWILQNEWLSRVIALAFDDELLPVQDVRDDLERFQVLLHARDPNSKIINFYDWFLNADDPEAPQTAEAIIVQALDDILEMRGARPWGTGNRGVFILGPPLLFRAVEIFPFSNRATYAQCVEYGSDGPAHIESHFNLGPSATLYFNEEGEVVTPAGTLMTPEQNMLPQPVEGDPYFSMSSNYINFILRPFPLFEQ